ncbi:MAG: hypothetical protein L3J69_10155 [Desulfobacula sp.]|nr:hypothetical protein [Desulfobacula sp.]
MTIIAVTILLILIIGIVMVIKNKRSKQSKPLAPVSPSPKPPVENEFETILKSLLDLNILMRKDNNFSIEMTKGIEMIMDDLMIVIPAMIERYPGETLTYEIKKIGKEHLYKTVKEYLDLSLESRTHQFDVFKQTIDNLQEVSNRSRDIVENNETAEFKTMANFLSAKFS